MTGDELAKLAEARVFRPAVMDAVINEFVPPADAFLLTDAFLPFKNVERDQIVDLVESGAFGRTHPVNLGAEHKRITIPGSRYKEHTPGAWREAVAYPEPVLRGAVNPRIPTELWGEGLAIKALNFLDLRLNTLIEYLTSKIVITGKFSEARFGVNYTYDPKLPTKFFKNVTSSPGWPSGGTWATRASSTPTTDVMEAALLAQRYGLRPVSVIMSAKTSMDYMLSSDTQNKVKASFQLIGRNSQVGTIFDTLTGFPVEIDNRLYAEEIRLTAASAVGDTTLDVEDATEFAANDVLTLRNTLDEEEEVTISSISGNVITLTAGVVKAYQIGDRATAYKQFVPDNHFILKCVRDDRSTPNNWLSVPSLVKGKNWANPLPGRYTWQWFSAKVPYILEVGAGIEGGPKVSACTWMTVKTVA